MPKPSSFALFTLPPLLLLLTYGTGEAGQGGAHKRQQEDSPQQVISISHATNVQTPVGLIRLRQDEKFEIDITHTFPDCFLYNFKAIPVTPPSGGRQPEIATEEAKIQEGTVPFLITHDRSIGSYQIAIVAKDLTDTAIKDQCDALAQKPQTYTVIVTTYGWTLGFAGAFTGDKLTDPVFSLRAGTQVSGEGANQKSTDGYFIEENKGAADSFRLGSAAMIHLYNSDPNLLQIGHSSITWAPLSFGLGVNGGSQAHYYLGTSFKFGDQAFLTFGAVFGPRKRLPDSLGVGSFTTDQNALSSLPTRNSSAFFVGLSYTFISVSQDTFKGQFQPSTPAPSSGGGEGAGENQ